MCLALVLGACGKRGIVDRITATDVTVQDLVGPRSERLDGRKVHLRAALNYHVTDATATAYFIPDARHSNVLYYCGAGCPDDVYSFAADAFMGIEEAPPPGSYEGTGIKPPDLSPGAPDPNPKFREVSGRVHVVHSDAKTLPGVDADQTRWYAHHIGSSVTALRVVKLEGTADSPALLVVPGVVLLIALGLLGWRLRLRLRKARSADEVVSEDDVR